MDAIVRDLVATLARVRDLLACDNDGWPGDGECSSGNPCSQCGAIAEIDAAIASATERSEASS